MNETELESLLVRLLGDSTQYQEMLREAEAQTVASARQVESAASQVQSYGSSLQSFATSVVGVIGSLVGGLSLLGGVIKGIGLAAEAEKTEIAFSTMLKSADAGKQMVKDLQDFAAATPLNTEDIQRAAKTLLQFGVAGEDILGTMRQLGDVTGGDATRFNQMALAFGQMAASGRLMGQDLLQMINAGFNPLQEIARTTGKDMGFLKAEMEKGRISLTMVKEAFKSATSEGGQFAGLMEKQSKSLSGLFSTMQDDISATLRTLGKDISEALDLRGIMQSVSSGAQMMTETVKALSPEIKLLVGTFGTLGIVLGTTWIAWSTLTTAIGIATAVYTATTTAVMSLVAALGSLTVVGSLWAVVALGTVVALTAAIVGVTYAANALGKQIFGTAEAERELNKEINETIALRTRLVQRQAAETERIVAQSQGPLTTDAKHQFLTSEIEKAQKEVAGYQARVKGSEQAVAELNTIWNRWTGNKLLEVANVELGEQERLLGGAKDRVTQLQAEMKKLDPTEVFKKMTGEAAKLEEKLTTQIATFGMSAEQAAIYKLQLEGATQAQLENARGLAQMVEWQKEEKKAKDEAAKATAHLAKDGQNFQESLELSIATFGMSSEEAKLYKLEMQGLDSAIVGHIQGLIEQQEALKANKKIMEQGEKVTKDILGHEPDFKFHERITELNELLEAGAITQDVYALGMEQAEDALNKAEKGAKNATKEFQKFDSALLGSAEAATRFQSYQDQVRAIVDKQRKTTGKVDMTDAQKLGPTMSGGVGQPTPMDMGPGDIGKPSIMESGMSGGVGSIRDFTRAGSGSGDASSSRVEKSNEYLRDIRDALKREEKKAVVTLEPVNLSSGGGTEFEAF